MAGYHGADVAQLRALGMRFDHAADEIERAGRVLAAALAAAGQWQGPDAATFRGSWGTAYHPRLTGAASALRSAARTVRANADQQQAASRPDGGAGAAGAMARAPAAVSAWSFGTGVGTVSRPPSGVDAAGANQWWRDLTEQQRAAVIADHPEWIGNRDGIPAWARDQANRSLIDDYRTSLEAERDRLRADLADNVFGGLFTNDDRRLEIVEGKLRGLEAIDRTLRLGNRQLLVLNVTGAEQLKAAVAVGDVDTADHVAVFTPGLTSTVQDKLGGYDADMAALKSLATAEGQKYGQGGTVATVTWLGYEAPQVGQILSTDRSVLRDDLAVAGSGDLAEFYRGINASRLTDPHLTALGHSYGSLTTGLALRSETGVDDAVFFGSPGIGTGSIGELVIPHGHAYLVESPTDLVADAGDLGPRVRAGVTAALLASGQAPAAVGVGVTLDGVGDLGGDPSGVDGLISLSADDSVVDGAPLRKSRGFMGHLEYLTRATTSQQNLAVIVAGVPERAVRG